MMFGKEKTTMPVGILTTKTVEGADQEGLVERIGEHISKHNLNIFVGPEFLFMPKDRLYSKQEKDAIIQRLAEFTKDKEILLIPGTIMWEDEESFYNTAPVIANGKILGEYHKQTDGHSIKHAKKRGVTKEYHMGDRFGMYDWGDLKVGVEVCADYGNLRAEQPEGIDLYIIPSAGFDYGPFGGVMREGDELRSPPISKRGYIFNADGRRGTSIVSPKYPDKMDPKGKDLELDIYEIPGVRSKSMRTLFGR